MHAKGTIFICQILGLLKSKSWANLSRIIEQLLVSALKSYLHGTCSRYVDKQLDRTWVHIWCGWYLFPSSPP